VFRLEIFRNAVNQSRGLFSRGRQVSGRYPRGGEGEIERERWKKGLT
jgi:hypothetical protein